MSVKRALSSTELASSSSSKRFAPWFNALENSLKDSSLHLFENDRVIIIADKFPKARFHFLTLPREEIDNLEQLNSSHVALVEHMIAQSRDFAKIHIEAKSKNPVRFGFHMVPSMARLHLHIISQDFNSSCLKNKKHWNSFTTPFFVDAEAVLDILKEKGKVVVDKTLGEGYLKDPLRCHVCRASLANIPKLKDHIRTHDKDRVVK
jgi:aprataxin